jgi:hypothetical protein
MAITLEPQVKWTSPAPLWREHSSGQNGGDRAAFGQPSILRFTTDTFMDEFAAVLDNQPWQLGQWRAAPEAWWSPLPEPGRIETEVQALPPRARSLKRSQQLRMLASAALSQSDNGTEFTNDIPETLKLFQPAHQRFYLVSSCLVCRIPGLPDRVLDVGASERAAFVVRRLRPRALADGATTYPVPDEDYANTFDEYAFVSTPEGFEWQRVTLPVMAGEELNPMFGVSYVENDGRRRRLLSGLVPVAKREAYMGASAPAVRDDLPTCINARMGVWHEKVAGPWRGLIDMHKGRLTELKKTYDLATNKPNLTGNLESITSLNDQVRMMSWYIMLDFADYLKKYLPDVWRAMSTAENDLASGSMQRALYDTLAGISFKIRSNNASFRYDICRVIPDSNDPNLAIFSARHHDATSGIAVNETSFVDALVAVEAACVQLEGAMESYRSGDAGWPDVDFPLITLQLQSLLNGREEVLEDVYCTPHADDVFSATLDELIEAALDEVDPPRRTPPVPLAAKLSAMDSGEPGWFVIRCVFSRPNCGPLKPVEVSEPTVPFQLASFFEPEAPARPIRIALPVDTSPAGLRKFAKNTGFVMSDILCGQVNKFKKLGFIDLVLQVLPWPFHQDLNLNDMGPCDEEGMVCSLSIPIVTLCALIVLIIIVSLLDYVFKWLPFLMMCFPLPKYTAKEAT